MTTTPTTLVSIILPTYNGARFLRRAIESVIAQTYTAWELLVIDDGSIDDTPAILAELQQTDSRIRYIKNTYNLGIQKTLNKGIKESKGVYIARIDDDDVWAQVDKLEQQVSFLEENPEYVLVGTGVILIDETEKEIMRYFLPETDHAIRTGLLAQNRFVHSSVLFRKDTVIELDGYSESVEVRHVEDYDLWLRLGMKGMLANIPQYAVKFTVREGSISGSNKIDQFYKNIALIKKYKAYYPHHTSAIIRSYIRIFIYGFLVNTPLKGMINWGIGFYKRFL